MAFAENLQDPFPNFMFSVQSDGLNLAAFTKISGLGAEIEYFEYDELGSGTAQKFAEKIKYDDLILDKGQISQLGIFSLYDMSVDYVLGKGQANSNKVNLEITQKNFQGGIVRKWLIYRAGVKKWGLSEMDSINPTYMVERMVLTHHGIEIAK